MCNSDPSKKNKLVKAGILPFRIYTNIHWLCFIWFKRANDNSCIWNEGTEVTICSGSCAGSDACSYTILAYAGYGAGGPVYLEVPMDEYLTSIYRGHNSCHDDDSCLLGPKGGCSGLCSIMPAVGISNKVCCVSLMDGFAAVGDNSCADGQFA